MTGLLHEKEFSRKSFLKGGGALIVGFSLAGAGLAGKAQAAADSPFASNGPFDQSQVDSWIDDPRRQHGLDHLGPDRAGHGHRRPVPDDRRRRARHGHEPARVSSRDDTNVDAEHRRYGGSNAIETAARRSARRPRCATQALLGLASTQLGVPVAQPDGEQGRRLGRRQDRHLRPADRRQALQRHDARATTATPQAASRHRSGCRRAPPAKPVSQYKLVGTTAAADRHPGERHRHVHLHPQRPVPGMLHGRVVRPRGQARVRRRARRSSRSTRARSRTSRARESSGRATSSASSRRTSTTRSRRRRS